MSPGEIKGVVIGLTIIIGLSTWLLTGVIQHYFRLKNLKKQREWSDRTRMLEEEEVRALWPWPPKGKYAPPGEWGGPSKALERFLNRRYCTVKVTINLKGAAKAMRQMKQAQESLSSLAGRTITRTTRRTI